MQTYRLVTIERGGDSQFRVLRWANSSSLAALVDYAHRTGCLPGHISGTGMTIIETIFESVP